MTQINQRSIKSIIRSKGWLVKEVALRWGYSPRHLSRLLSKNCPQCRDAALGLPLRDQRPASESFLKAPIDQNESHSNSDDMAETII